MSTSTLQFIMDRVERLVQEARNDARTLAMVRGYLNRVFEYARARREPELMRFVSEQEKMIGHPEVQL